MGGIPKALVWTESLKKRLGCRSPISPYSSWEIPLCLGGSCRVSGLCFLSLVGTLLEKTVSKQTLEELQKCPGGRLWCDNRGRDALLLIFICGHTEDCRLRSSQCLAFHKPSGERISVSSAHSYRVTGAVGAYKLCNSLCYCSN